MKNEATYWLLRLVSSGGTDRRMCVMLPKGTTTAKALDFADKWGERATKDTAIRQYSVKVLRIRKPPKRAVWLKRWAKVCKAYEAIKDKKDTLLAIGTPYDWRG